MCRRNIATYIIAIGRNNSGSPLEKKILPYYKIDEAFFAYDLSSSGDHYYLLINSGSGITLDKKRKSRTKPKPLDTPN